MNRKGFSLDEPIIQAERMVYDIISEAHQELESAIEDLRKLDPKNEELSTMEEYLKNME